jgi:hypothetical protein
MSIPQDGFGAAFFRVFFGDIEFSENCDRLSYIYDEKEDDECEITVRLADPNEADLPQYQEKAELKVVWGFINGETIQRIVHIQEAKEHCAKDSVYLILCCTEKGASMKSSSDRAIARDGIIGAATDKADKHGLTAYLEIPDDGIRLDSLPGETTTQYITRVNRVKAEKMYAEQEKMSPDVQQKNIRILLKEWRDSSHSKEYEVRRQVMKDYDDGVDINVEQEVKRRLAMKDLARFISDNFHGPLDHNLPQAGKSDKQFLQDIGKRTNNGTTVVETRDNDLIIKKRNYNQRPYKTYVYGASEGELLEFAPETQNKRKKGSAAAMGFAGWDALNKQFFSGQADPTNPNNNASLSKALDMIRQGEIIQRQGGGRTIFLSRPTGQTISSTTIPSGSNLIVRTDPGTGLQVSTFVPNNHLSIVDNSGNTGKIGVPLVVGVSVDDHVSALKKAVDEFRDKIKQKQKDYYSSVGIDPNAAFNGASNLRSDNELKKHPATFKIWPDPKIEVGIIVTALNVGKKHSGNYYITKSTHVIEKGSGYELELEGAKHGHNIISNEDYVSAEQVGRKVNKLVGPDETGPKSKSIKVKTNPQKR